MDYGPEWEAAWNEHVKNWTPVEGAAGYKLEDLKPDPLHAAYIILKKIKEWIECDDFSTFVPLRCTLDGKGGTGKSVLINTIVSVLRRRFNLNNVVAVAAPTGTAACNVNGVTLHSFSAQTPEDMDREHKPGNLNKTKMEKLLRKNKDLLCIIIDERSLLSAKMMGNTEQIVAETTYEGIGK